MIIKMQDRIFFDQILLKENSLNYPFAILLRYLPVKRNLHYLALGFGLTAMLTVLYSNIQTLGGAVSSIVGTLPKDAAITFANNFKSLSMIDVAIFGIFLAVQHFKYSQRTVAAAPEIGRAHV